MKRCKTRETVRRGDLCSTCEKDPILNRTPRPLLANDVFRFGLSEDVEKSSGIRWRLCNFLSYFSYIESSRFWRCHPFYLLLSYIFDISLPYIQFEHLYELHVLFYISACLAEQAPREIWAFWSKHSINDNFIRFSSKPQALFLIRSKCL